MKISILPSKTNLRVWKVDQEWCGHLCPLSFCYGRRQPSQEDKSGELINQFHGKSGRRRGTFLCRSVFGFECTRSENKDLHIHAKISRSWIQQKETTPTEPEDSL